MNTVISNSSCTPTQPFRLFDTFGTPEGDVIPIGRLRPCDRVTGTIGGRRRIKPAPSGARIVEIFAGAWESDPRQPWEPLGAAAGAERVDSIDYAEAERQFREDLGKRNVGLGRRSLVIGLMSNGSWPRADALNKQGRSGRGDAQYVINFDGWPRWTIVNRTDGQGYSSGTYKPSGRDPTEDEDRQIKKAAKQNLADQIENNKRREEAQKKIAAGLRVQFERARPANPQHPYLVGKGVGVYGIKQTFQTLMIPVMIDGEIWSVQYIFRDQSGKFVKRFKAGARAKDGLFIIPGTVGTIYIVEGYATAATVFEITGATCIVTFSDSGQLAGAEYARKAWPTARVVVCADDDWQTRGNPGLTKATEAAEATRAVLAVPFNGVSIASRVASDTDFNDLARLLGTDAVRAILVPPPRKIDGVLAVFNKWLKLKSDTPVLAVLGTVAANLLPGDAVWLGLIAPPSSAKTEILNSLSLLPYVQLTATLTEAALLSGTPRKQKAKGSTGGLLRKIGTFGIVVMKDFGSILSMRQETKAIILAALREIYDGRWTRQLGTDGGMTLDWEGKAGLIFGGTEAYDDHYTVIGVLGDRFLLCRLQSSGDEDQMEKAFDHTGEKTKKMRDELAGAVSDLFAQELGTPPALSEKEKRRIGDVVRLAIRLRAHVERDRFSKEILNIHSPEGPSRLALCLAGLLNGLKAIGVDGAEALSIVEQVALDSTPPLRRRAFELLDANTKRTTRQIAIGLDLPTSTARRKLEELAAHGLAGRERVGGAGDEQAGGTDGWYRIWDLANNAYVYPPDEYMGDGVDGGEAPF